MDSVLELWKEVILEDESDSLADPILLSLLQTTQTHPIFNKMSDEKVKPVFSLINSLLNDVKGRDKGALVFTSVISSIPINRLINFQDQLNSALHLICRNIGSAVAQSALITFLPMCKSLPDVNQNVTSSVVSKVVGFCIEQLQEPLGERAPPDNPLQLLGIILDRYRGPCGNFRDKLERAIVPFLDHENGDLVHNLCRLLPLVSSTGGGGSAGDKHSKDWSAMVNRIMSASYVTLYQLYSDVCPNLEDENPYDGGELPTLALASILQPRVFLRMNLLKRRLINLINALSSYLRNSFSGAKPVPVAKLLKLITQLIIVNPLDVLEQLKGGSRKEVVLLSTLLPDIHESAFKLLDSLIVSLKSNLLPNAVQVEQIFTQEWKWMEKDAGLTKSFESLKLRTYCTLKSWLDMNYGNVTNSKTLNLWLGFFVKEIRLEKGSVELRLMPKSKKEKKQLKIQNLPSLTSDAGTDYVQKSSGRCELALDILVQLIPTMDSAVYTCVYKVLGQTHVELYQTNSYPSPYDKPSCRLKLNNALKELVLNPNPRSRISVSLVVGFLKKGALDPVTAVSSHCQASISVLERIVHPTSLSLEMPDFAFSRESAPHPDDGVFGETGSSQVDDEESESVERREVGVQTVEVKKNLGEQDGQSSSEEEDSYNREKLERSSSRKGSNAAIQIILESIRDIQKAIKSPSQNSNRNSPAVNPSELSSGNEGGGSGQTKRKIYFPDDMDDEEDKVLEGTSLSNGDHFSPASKMLKLMDEEERAIIINGNDVGNGIVEVEIVSEELNEMLGDFVDAEPHFE